MPALDELMRIVEDMGFKIVSSRRTDAPYGISDGEDGGNMRPDFYRPVLFVAIKTHDQ